MLDDVLLATASHEHERVRLLGLAGAVDDAEVNVAALQVVAVGEDELEDLPHLGVEESGELRILDRLLAVHQVAVLLVQAALAEQRLPVRILQEHRYDIHVVILDRDVQTVLALVIQGVERRSLQQQQLDNLGCTLEFRIVYFKL